MLEQGRQRGRARPLDQGFLDLQQQHDGLFDVALVHQQKVVHVAADQLDALGARRAHGDALGNGAHALLQLRALHQVGHGRKAPRLHPHHGDAGLDGFGGGGHAGDQPTAADGHHQRIQFGLLRQHLQRGRTLAGHDGDVVVGVHEHQVLGVGQLPGVRVGLFQRGAVQDHLRAEAARARHLDAGREAGHDDGGRDAQALRVIGHALRVVARAHGDHAARALGRRQLHQLVAGAALLEAGGELQVLELEEHLRARQLGQRARFHARGFQHLPAHPRGGLLNVGQAQHGAIVRASGQAAKPPTPAARTRGRTPS